MIERLLVVYRPGTALKYFMHIPKNKFNNV